MSFGEYVTAGGFNQKTIKEDLFIKANHVYPRRYRLGKVLEDTRRCSTEADPEVLPCGAGQPHLQADQPMGPSGQPLL